LAGKEQVLGFLVGQVMKRSKGKANPKLVNELIIRQIKE
jgi:Asp-tRNAAsn/Glu-tRNAGln amidotransferase B subunit (PET112 homolog)